MRLLSCLSVCHSSSADVAAAADDDDDRHESVRSWHNRRGQSLVMSVLELCSSCANEWLISSSANSRLTALSRCLSTFYTTVFLFTFVFTWFWFSSSSFSLIFVFHFTLGEHTNILNKRTNSRSLVSPSLSFGCVDWKYQIHRPSHFAPLPQWKRQTHILLLRFSAAQAGRQTHAKYLLSIAFHSHLTLIGTDSTRQTHLLVHLPHGPISPSLCICLFEPKCFYFIIWRLDSSMRKQKAVMAEVMVVVACSLPPINDVPLNLHFLFARLPLFPLLLFAVGFATFEAICSTILLFTLLAPAVVSHHTSLLHER